MKTSLLIAFLIVVSFHVKVGDSMALTVNVYGLVLNSTFEFKLVDQQTVFADGQVYDAEDEDEKEVKRAGAVERVTFPTRIEIPAIHEKEAKPVDAVERVTYPTRLAIPAIHPRDCPWCGWEREVVDENDL